MLPVKQNSLWHKIFSELISGETPTLVDFFAEWCGPCKTLKPILEDLKNKMGDDIKIVKIDVDKNPGIAGTYQVQGVPTLILFKNGQLKWRQSGVMRVKQLQEVIRQYAV